MRWWEGATIYHVYVRSWLDTDGDGFGDLGGVRRRLDYLAELGVDALWLSPTTPSPDTDWGYDVSDYYGVHPELGTLEDVERLVEEAGASGRRVVLDLVPNHTSDRHPWFVDACEGRDAAYRDWYVWADPAPDGGVPNNWLDATGGSAWTLHEPTRQYYLHNFLPTQPDLNWWNPEVRGEFDRILRYWFDRGIAGFRIDVAHALYHDRELRDDPPCPVGPGARFGLDPIHSMNQPEVHQVYREWRKLADEYEPKRLLLGETWVLDTGRLATFYGKDDELDLGFNLPFVFATLDARTMPAVVASTLAALPERACPVWVGSNHDVSRFPSRWADGDPTRARLAGTAVLYYGDELGLPDVPVPHQFQRDPMSRGVSGSFSRDRARTPMPWTTAPHAGFCPEVVAPWLPIGDRRGLTVQEEQADDGSVLWLTRRLLDLRRRALGGRVVSYEQIPAAEPVWLYRSGPLLVAANLGDHKVALEVPGSRGAVALSSRRDGETGPRGPELVLASWEAVVIESDAREGDARG
jgi:alpha-glucosidase